MRTYRIFLTLLMTACLISVSVNSSAFTNYPEDIVALGWQTPFPYQRNISLDFTVDPFGSGKIQGAQYEGYLDSELWGEDAFEYNGVTVETDTEGGRIGIAGGGSGYISLNLNNLDTPNPVKRIYMEARVKVSNAVAAAAQDWLAGGYDFPPGHTVDDSEYDVQVINFFTGEFRLYGWAKILPNPPSEFALVYFNIPVNASNWAWVYDLSIASECVGPMQLPTDLDSDGDVDGMELARMATTDIEITLDEFAMDFGEIA